MDASFRKSRGAPAPAMTGGRPAPPAPPRGPFPRVLPRLDRNGMLAAQMAALQPRAGFGLPNLRRNVCPHFYMAGPRGPMAMAAPHLLKAWMRHKSTVSRCHLRRGVHLDSSYVSDICLSSRFNQCVFYEEELTTR